MRVFSHKGRQFAAGKQTLKNSKNTNRNLKNTPPKRITKGHFLSRNNTKARWDEIILPTQICVNTKTLFLGFLMAIADGMFVSSKLSQAEMTYE